MRERETINREFRTLLGTLLALIVAVPICAQPPRVDALGDPLPPGAILRLGTQRLAPISRQPAFVLTPDGKQLITAGNDSVQTPQLAGVQFWDTDTGKLLRSWPCTEVDAQSLALSPDGRWLATHPFHERFCLRDANSGKLKHVLHGGDTYNGQYYAVSAFSPAGKTLAFMPGGFNKVILWDVASGKARKYLTPVLGTPRCFLFSPDGRYLAAGMGWHVQDREIKVWDAKTGKYLYGIPKKSIAGLVDGLAFLPDQRHFLVSTSQLTLHDCATGKLVRVLRQDGIGALATDHLGKRMFAGNGEIWDLEKLQVIQRVPLTRRGSVTMSADGKRAASMYPLRVWDVATGKATFDAPGQGHVIDHAIFSPDDQRIVTLAEKEGVIQLWDAKTGRSLDTVGTPPAPAKPDRSGPLRFSDDPGRLIVGKEVWDLPDKTCVKSLPERASKKARDRENHSLVMSPDTKIAVDWEKGRAVQFWDVATGQLLRKLPVPHDIRYHRGLPMLAFAPDSRILAITAQDRKLPEERPPTAAHPPTLLLVETASGKILHELRRTFNPPGPPVWSQDGQWLAMTRYEFGIEIWHIPSGRLARELFRGDDSLGYWPIFALAPHAQLLACSDKEHAIILCETTTAQRILELPGHGRPITSLAFSHDGRRILSVSEDRTVLVWSLDILPRARLTQDEDTLWQDLSGDAAKVYPILWALMDSPKRAVGLAHKRLKSDDLKDLDRLIADLGSEVFARRISAMQRLHNLGLAALPAIQAALTQPRDLEHRRRLEELVRTIVTQPAPPELLRALRTIQLLEMVGTPEARQELQRVAQGLPQGPRAIAARSALARIARRGER